MLLRFSTSNHLSMRDRQEISLVASPLKDDETGLIECAASPSGRLVPAAVIYGANASGKSNFVQAINFMRDAILLSHRRGEPGGAVSRKPFALDPSRANTSSEFDADFVANGVHYQYGFEASDEFFNAEWLYAFPKGRRQTLFERKGGKFTFGRELKGRNRVIADLTRPNSLFLSAAAQNDHTQLSKVVEFFRSFRIDTAISVPGEDAAQRFEEDDVDRRVIDFLSRIGTGVINYRRQETERAQEIQLDSVLLHTLKGSDVKVELGHEGHDGEAVFFDLNRESAGTRRLLILLTLVFQALDEGTLLVIDELDASLHTQAGEAILALFSSPKTNPKGAQMIATTHDTNLLSSPLLRRDQVWLTEKDAKGATHLYPLTDIRTRKGDNIEKGYLQGRFGATPGEVSDLIVAD